MEKYFSIGEISALLHLPSHTLRYYDKIGLLRPAVTNETTGYRMYAYEQLFTLERIKHMQYLGFSLDEIRTILSDSEIHTMTEHLKRRKRELVMEQDRVATLLRTVNAYLDYYTQCDDGLQHRIPYKKELHERHILFEPYQPGEALNGTAGYRLMVRKSEPDLANKEYLRQIGFVLDYSALLEGVFRPTHYFMLLENRPPVDFPEIRSIPAGSYLCYRTHISGPQADIPVFKQLLSSKRNQPLALACEFEQSLDDSCESWLESLFEIQVLL